MKHLKLLVIMLSLITCLLAVSFVSTSSADPDDERLKSDIQSVLPAAK